MSEVGGAAQKIYPATEVRGGDKRNYLASEVRGSGGWEEIPHAPSPGQGQRQGGATTRPRPRAVAGRTNPKSKEPWLCRHKRA